MKFIEIKGNLLNTESPLIAHGVNCQGVMGSGVAKAIYERYPEVREDYLQMFKENPDRNPDYYLGEVQFVMVGKNLHVANCFTQQNFGGGDQVYLNYKALGTAMIELADFMDKMDIKELAIPKIGCGLAGGDWEKVKKVIEGVFRFDDVTIKVYSL